MPSKFLPGASVGYNGNTGAPAHWDESSGMWIDTNGQQIRDDAIRAQPPSSASPSPAPPPPPTAVDSSAAPAAPSAPVASAVGGLAAASPSSTPTPGTAPSAVGAPSSSGSSVGAPGVPYNISSQSAMRSGIGQRSGSNLNPALVGLKSYY